jgi:hypothetical protein
MSLSAMPRTYHVVHTGTNLVIEGKQRWARLVLGWTTRESTLKEVE